MDSPGYPLKKLWLAGELAACQAQNSGVCEHVHDAQATWRTEDVHFTHRRLSTVCSNPTVNPVILNVFFPP